MGCRIGRIIRGKRRTSFRLAISKSHTQKIQISHTFNVKALSILTYSLTYSLIHSFIHITYITHKFTRPYHSLTHILTHLHISPIHSFISLSHSYHSYHSLIRITHITHSFISLTYITYSNTHSFIHSCYSLIHSLTHSLAYIMLEMQAETTTLPVDTVKVRMQITTVRSFTFCLCVFSSTR